MIKMASYVNQPDNTFFVESDEHSSRAAPIMNAKDTAKMMARNRQEMIANELSRLAWDEYLEDIMRHMRQLEVRLLRCLLLLLPPRVPPLQYHDSHVLTIHPGRDLARRQPHRHAA